MTSELRSATHDFGRLFLPGVRVMFPLLVCALSLAGCVTASDVPHIDRPLAIDSYRSDPCGMLTAQQVQQFGIADPSRMVFREQCELDDRVSARRLALGMTNSGDQLSPQPIAQMYKNSKTTPESFGYFDPVVVQGYPAVLADFPDLRSMGTCKITVGVSDSASISVLFSTVPGATEQPLVGDPCVQARNIADTIVTNFKAKPSN